MKTYKLSELLGLKGAYARRFNYEITSLESKKPQTKSVSAQIMANLYKKSRDLEQELGFLQSDVLNVEAISALKNKLNDDDFWETFFNDNPQEAARATYFGDIRNWNDPYIRFNAYSNLETTYSIDYEPYEQEIIKKWLKENL